MAELEKRSHIPTVIADELHIVYRVNGAKTGKDYVYMHMEQRGRAKEGSRVRTGDVIGYESDTGDAQGCHLHFELWSAPGWYEGGHVLNPTRPLKKWDKYS